ncbi:MAG: SAM-dependent methyltransferase [Fibrobacteraceae bacterium]|mgnify:CR=1 FL=1|nr:SAM-dependent methyltransferase [Fibrobacteraceae bacterium]
MTENKAYQGVHQVTSNQTDIHEKLQEIVSKYAATSFLRPVANHTQKAFEKIKEVVRQRGAPLVLDSGCGIGESTIHLAKKFPQCSVIGIDKSELRLSKEKPLKKGEDIPPNAFWIRAELLDFWKLALEEVKNGNWNIKYHALYYPNPWPKQSEAGRRFHLHPIFPTLMKLSPVTELRTNWEIYAKEFAKAAQVLLASKVSIECSKLSEGLKPITAFERKYQAVGQSLYQVVVTEQTWLLVPPTSSMF